MRIRGRKQYSGTIADLARCKPVALTRENARVALSLPHLRMRAYSNARWTREGGLGGSSQWAGDESTHGSDRDGRDPLCASGQGPVRTDISGTGGRNISVRDSREKEGDLRGFRTNVAPRVGSSVLHEGVSCRQRRSIATIQ